MFCKYETEMENKHPVLENEKWKFRLIPATLEIFYCPDAYIVDERTKFCTNEIFW